VGAALHRIEALPGAARYAVSFRHDDGSEQAAVIEFGDDGATIAEASLPDEWRTPAARTALFDAVRAVDAARSAVSGAHLSLRDVPGGWDVSLGNVVLSAGVPTCTAHGPLDLQGDRYVCAECGAAALAAKT
jgi:hypothetical protein